MAVPNFSAIATHKPAPSRMATIYKSARRLLGEYLTLPWLVPRENWAEIRMSHQTNKDRDRRFSDKAGSRGLMHVVLTTRTKPALPLERVRHKLSAVRPPMTKARAGPS